MKKAHHTEKDSDVPGDSVSNGAPPPSVIDSRLARGLRRFHAQDQKQQFYGWVDSVIEGKAAPSVLQQLINQGSILHKFHVPKVEDINAGWHVVHAGFRPHEGELEIIYSELDEHGHPTPVIVGSWH